MESSTSFSQFSTLMTLDTSPFYDYHSVSSYLITAIIFQKAIICYLIWHMYVYAPKSLTEEEVDQHQQVPTANITVILD